MRRNVSGLVDTVYRDSFFDEYTAADNGYIRRLFIDITLLCGIEIYNSIFTLGGNLMYCGKCGAVNPDNGKFCTTCGAPLPAGKQSEVNQASLYRQTVSGTTGTNAASPGSVGKKNDKYAVIGVIICVVIAIIAIRYVMPRNVVDKQYTWEHEGISGPTEYTGTYTGRWQHGQPVGSGTMKYTNGDVYEGEWDGGRPEGQGTLRYSNGVVYTGTFQWGIPMGEGVVKYPNGDRFRGEMDFGGIKQGTMEYADGSIYTGGFRMGMPWGQGTWRYPTDDLVYEGEFVRGQWNGHGILRWEDGTIYEGEFKEDQMTGRGTYTFTDGRQISGTWVNGEFVLD